VRTEALREVARLAPDTDEREHVTMGVYRRPERFRLHGVTQADDLSALRWTVDYPADLEFATLVYGALHEHSPRFGQDEILALLDREPRLRRFETDVAD
jgi:spore coat polysaccharide biosynthesis protein SpsF